MVSDAIHSLSDVFTSLLVIIGLVISKKAPDKKHPYGHERMESVIAVILSFMLFITGCIVGFTGLNVIINHDILLIPSSLALVAAIISILVKELMYRYTIIIAKKLNSPSIQADAWHHRSDALSSVGSFIGIFFSRLGIPLLDPICSILICILIIKSSIEIFMNATSQMLDTSCDDEFTKKLLKTISDTHENIVINELKTRMFGNKIYIDLEIGIDGNINLKDANKIVLNIHNIVEEKYKEVKHCNIHTVPINK